VNNTIASVVIRDAAGVDVTDQFASITRESGVLSLYPRTVKLTSRSASKVYDGTPLTAPEVTVSGDGFVVGEVTNIRATGSISQVGSAANAIAYTTGRSYDSRNYNITTEEGTLVITRTNSEIVVTSGSASKVYDGTPLIATGVTAILPEGFEGYTVTALVTGIATNVSEGTVANTLTDIRIHDPNGNDVTDQFEENAWTIIEGTLNITPRTVIMTSGSATKVFDATPLTSYQITESGDGFVAGEGVNYNVTGTQTLVGTGTNTFAYAARPGTDLRNYVITQIEGILTVTAAAPVPVPPGPVPPAPIPPAAPIVPAPVPPAAPIVPAPVYTPTEPEVVRVTPETPAPTPTPEIVQAEDVETPLADIPKKKDNALPFLLLTAAWIILMIFAGRMKKQQKKVFEMTEELNDKQMDAEIRNGSQSAGTKK
jgi:hypothetical protein